MTPEFRWAELQNVARRLMHVSERAVSDVRYGTPDKLAEHELHLAEIHAAFELLAAIPDPSIRQLERVADSLGRLVAVAQNATPAKGGAK